MNSMCNKILKNVSHEGIYELILHQKTTYTFIVFMCIQVKTTNELLYFRYNDLKLR